MRCFCSNDLKSHFLPRSTSPLGQRERDHHCKAWTDRVKKESSEIRNKYVIVGKGRYHLMGLTLLTYMRRCGHWKKKWQWWFWWKWLSIGRSWTTRPVWPLDGDNLQTGKGDLQIQSSIKTALQVSFWKPSQKCFRTSSQTLFEVSQRMKRVKCIR